MLQRGARSHGAGRMMPREATTASDTALVQAARRGDKGAYALLLTRHWSLLSSLCRHALGDPLAAEDAAQEAAL